MKWDGIPLHTGLGKGPLFLIYCLSGRTAREYALPTSDRRLVFQFNHQSEYRPTRFVEEPDLFSFHDNGINPQLPKP